MQDSFLHSAGKKVWLPGGMETEALVAYGKGAVKFEKYYSGSKDKVTEFVNEVLEEKDCPLKVQMQLDVAIDEIFGNIAYYAYGKGSGNATIQIEMEDNPPKITLIFIDQGIPYNPLENKDPDITLDIEDREIGGLGIFLVKKTMDELSYEYVDGQNILTMKKELA